MARFKLVICCFPLLAAVCFAAMLQREKRGHAVPFPTSCVHMFAKSDRQNLDDKYLPLIMLHGLTDTKETWDGINGIISYSTGRRVCAYDARNHGDSLWNNTFNVDVLVNDLELLMNALLIEKASLVGHSMGGLTVMKFALKHPERVESIIVEDMAPNSITKEASEIMTIYLKVLLNSLDAIPPDADAETAKKAVKDYFLKENVFPLPEYLFTNTFPLRRRNGKWQWKANMEVFMTALGSYDSFVGKMDGRYDEKALFIYGTASDVKVNEQEEHIRILFPKAEFFGVEGASHNVHHDNHTVYVRKIVNFLN